MKGMRHFFNFWQVIVVAISLPIIAQQRSAQQQSQDYSDIVIPDLSIPDLGFSKLTNLPTVTGNEPPVSEAEIAAIGKTDFSTEGLEATTREEQKATPGGGLASIKSKTKCPPPEKADKTPCGMITSVCDKNDMKLKDLINGFFPPLVSILEAMPPLKSWLKDATLYEFGTSDSIVEACTAHGYLTDSAIRATTKDKTGKGQFRGFEPGRTVTAMQAMARIAGHDVQLKVRMDGTTINQNAFGFGTQNTSLLIGLPAIGGHIKFSSISPLFKPLDDIEIEEAAIVFSTRDYMEEEWETFVQQGITVLARLKLTGALGKLLSIAGYSAPTVTLKGFIATDIVGSYFSVDIDKKLKLGALGSTTGKLRLSIYFEQLFPGTPVPTVAFGISAGFTFKLPKCSKDVLVMGEFRINPFTSQITLSCWTEGFIQFDQVPLIAPFKIGNLVFAIGINPEQAAESLGILSVTEYFFGGTIGIGNKELRVYTGLNIAARGTNYIFDVEFTGGITLREIIGLGCDAINLVGGDINCDKILQAIPELGIKTLKGYICTRTATYAGRTFREGFEILAEAIIFGKKVGLDIKFIPTQGRITAAAWCDQFKLGPLYVTGRGMDMKWNTADDGPVIRLEVDVKKPPYFSFFASGLIDVRVKDLELLRASIDLFFSAQGIAFEFDCKVWGLFEAYVVLNAVGVPIADVPKIGPKITKEARTVAGGVIDIAATGMPKVLQKQIAWPLKAAKQEAFLNAVAAELREAISGGGVMAAVTSKFAPGLADRFKGLEGKVKMVGKQYDDVADKYKGEIDEIIQAALAQAKTRDDAVIADIKENAVNTVIARHADFKKVADDLADVKKSLDKMRAELNDAEQAAKIAGAQAGVVSGSLQAAVNAAEQDVNVMRRVYKKEIDQLGGGAKAEAQVAARRSDFKAALDKAATAREALAKATKAVGQ